VKKLYVLLSRTDTVPARVIRGVTGSTYSHTSLSLYPRTDHFYSYARRHINLPIFAGFISENIHTKVFARYPNSPALLLSIEVSDESYEKAKKLISYFRRHKKEATYNFWGAYAMPLGLPLKRMNKFTCSQFVAFVLYYSGAIELPKDPYLMMPDDFREIEGATVIYKGKLKDLKYPD
jgi:hypothetical protein